MSLMQKLIAWQQDTARREHLEPYMVLQFQTIKEIVRLQPKTSNELLHIKGIGAVKVRKYGDDILKIVRGEGISGGEIISSKEEFTGNLFAEADQVNEMASYSKDPVSVGMKKRKVKVDENTGEIIENEDNNTVSVTEFVTMLDTLMRTHFQSVRVQGEITGFKRNPNGHAYFEIKDKESLMRCAVFKSSYELSGIDLEDGMEVIVTGYPNYHKQYGFSFIGNTVELYGEGALKKAYEELKKKLDKEGLFSDERKRELPKLPERIGLITSRSGAAIGDFTTNVGQYGYKIIFHHSSVEGTSALTDLKNALTTMAKKDIDLLVVVRGGGSLESLQAFNNENIVRMIAEFPVPVVAGVGHEQDETITTLVADKGVSTPTAAARAVRESWDRVGEILNKRQQYLLGTFDNILSAQARVISKQETVIKGIFDVILQNAKELFTQFDFIVQRLEHILINKQKDLQSTLKHLSFVLDNIIVRYNRSIERAIDVLMRFGNTITNNTKHVLFMEKALENHNPQRQLRLGYSIATDGNGKVIRSVKDIKKDDKMDVQVDDGKINTVVQ